MAKLRRRRRVPSHMQGIDRASLSPTGQAAYDRALNRPIVGGPVAGNPAGLVRGAVSMFRSGMMPSLGDIARMNPNVSRQVVAGGSNLVRTGLDATGLDYPGRRGLIPGVPILGAPKPKKATGSVSKPKKRARAAGPRVR